MIENIIETILNSKNLSNPSRTKQTPFRQKCLKHKNKHSRNLSAQPHRLLLIKNIITTRTILKQGVKKEAGSVEIYLSKL